MRMIIVHSPIFFPYDQYLSIFLQAMASQEQYRMLNTNDSGLGLIADNN